MKINPGFRPMQSGLSSSDSGSKPIQSKNFSDMMNHQGERASQAELTRRLSEIQMQGALPQSVIAASLPDSVH